MYLKNEINFRKGRVTKLEYELKRLLYSNVQEWGEGYFYQSYPPLNIPGWRSTLSRVKIYRLEEYLNKNMDVLDIGGNVGFFSTYISKLVNQVSIIEKNPKLVKIGEKIIGFSKIDNVKFFCMDFKNINLKNKYDFIFSFAVHGWIGYEFREYLLKLHELLKNEGIVLIESHNIKNDDLHEKLNSVQDLFSIISTGTIDDDPRYVRKFYYLKKNSRQYNGK